MSSPYVSPLRYPGGKRRLTNYVKYVFKYNNLLDGLYIEPFAGGASVALSLLFDEYVSYIYINDISKPIFAMWHTILHETDALCSLIEDVDITVNEWHKQREIYYSNSDFVSLGFATLFLNRTNRSGIIEGGVIGGVNQTGKYKIDARFNKSDLIRRIRRIARYKDRIRIYNMDAIDFLQSIVSPLSGNILVYLDPPYYKKGKDLYVNFYDENDHVAIANYLSTASVRWMISYDDVPEIRALFSNYRSITYRLSYSAASRYSGKEVMFFHNDIVIPPIPDPVQVSLRKGNNQIIVGA